MERISDYNSEEIKKVYTTYSYRDGKSEYSELYWGNIFNHNKGERFFLMEDKMDQNKPDKEKPTSSVRKGIYQIYEIRNISSEEFGIGKSYKLKRNNLMSKLFSHKYQVNSLSQ